MKQERSFTQYLKKLENLFNTKKKVKSFYQPSKEHQVLYQQQFNDHSYAKYEELLEKIINKETLHKSIEINSAPHKRDTIVQSILSELENKVNLKSKTLFSRDNEYSKQISIQSGQLYQSKNLQKEELFEDKYKLKALRRLITRFQFEQKDIPNEIKVITIQHNNHNKQLNNMKLPRMNLSPERSPIQSPTQRQFQMQEIIEKCKFEMNCLQGIQKQVKKKQTNQRKQYAQLNTKLDVILKEISQQIY